MNILVVGGAGYIGSHMVKYLGKHNCNITILDNLSSGHKDAVKIGSLIVGDLADTELLNQLFSNNSFDIVIHFASSILVEESVANPSKYYRNNVTNTQNLLDTMVQHQVKKIIFSSTAAIFGEPKYSPIDEKHPKRPITPYGRSKWMVEQMLEDYDHAYGLKSICLRYFNAAGADPDGELGERHDPESHLVPLVLQAASGHRKDITIFGTNYNTFDGTCIRDYIHIVDLCSAHWLAIQHLRKHRTSQRYNLGNGNGFSVQEVIDTCKAVTQKDICVKKGSQRAGDPATLVSDSKRAYSELTWEPKYSELKVIIKHAWEWEKHQAEVIKV